MRQKNKVLLFLKFIYFINKLSFIHGFPIILRRD